MDVFDLDESECDSLPLTHHVSDSNTDTLNESIVSNTSYYDQIPIYKNHNHSQYHVKRDPTHRIFANRSFQLSDIKFFGFDMDHTLAGK